MRDFTKGVILLCFLAPVTLALGSAWNSSLAGNNNNNRRIHRHVLADTAGVTEWTSWFNIDHPGGNGDYERLEAIRFYYRERVCVRPSAMEARTTDWVAAEDTGEVVHSSLEKGFWCVNKEQRHGRICSNYHVRFHCPPVQAYWTDWSDWGPCSTEACGDVGIQVRHRKCVSNQPVPLLLVPACQGHHSERRECSTPPCTGDRLELTWREGGTPLTP